METLVGYLAGRPDVTLVGPRTAQKGLRVPVVSFMVAGRSSADIAAALQVTIESHCWLAQNTGSKTWKVLSAWGGA